MNLYQFKRDGCRAVVTANTMQDALELLNDEMAIDSSFLWTPGDNLIEATLMSPHGSKVLAHEKPSAFTCDKQPIPVEPGWEWEETIARSTVRTDGCFTVVLDTDEAVLYTSDDIPLPNTIIKIESLLYKVERIKFEDDDNCIVGLVVSPVPVEPNVPNADTNLPIADWHWYSMVSCEDEGESKYCVVLDPNEELCATKLVNPKAGEIVNLRDTLYRILNVRASKRYITLMVEFAGSTNPE